MNQTGLYGIRQYEVHRSAEQGFQIELQIHVMIKGGTLELNQQINIAFLIACITSKGAKKPNPANSETSVHFILPISELSKNFFSRWHSESLVAKTSLFLFQCLQIQWM
jgi:hypothetical protein